MDKRTKDKIVKWLRREVKKAQAKGVVVGLSGGIDSSVVAILCQLAFGKNSLALLMPCHSSPEDLKAARKIVKQLKMKHKLVDLSPVYDLLVKILPPTNKLTLANLKPRLRMLTLYYFANKLNYLVVGTGNKTELEIGYFTKYGDGGVDLLPLGGLYKREVGELAVQLEVPPEIIKKPPSAGLWNGQTDEKEIGLTYPTLDEILFALAKGKKLRATPAVRKVRELIKNSQHKREGVRIFSPK